MYQRGGGAYFALCQIFSYRAVCKAVGSPIQRGGWARHAAATRSWVPGGGAEVSLSDHDSYGSFDMNWFLILFPCSEYLYDSVRIGVDTNREKTKMIGHGKTVSFSLLFYRGHLD